MTCHDDECRAAWLLATAEIAKLEAEIERLRKSASAVEAPTGYYTTEARVVGVQTRPWGARDDDGVEAEITVRSVLSGSLPGRERTFPPVYGRLLVVTTFEPDPGIGYVVTSRRCPDEG